MLRLQVTHSSAPPHGHHLEIPSAALVEPASSSALTAVAGDRESAPATSTERSTQPNVIETLNELWVTVGCRSVWATPSKAERLRQLAKVTNTERMSIAREAARQALALQAHRALPSTINRVPMARMDDDVLIRERTEIEPAAWAD